MDVVSALKSERPKLQKRLDALDSAIKILGGKNGVGRGGKRHVSASARAKMSRAQKARRAKERAAQKT